MKLLMLSVVVSRSLSFRRVSSVIITNSLLKTWQVLDILIPDYEKILTRDVGCLTFSLPVEDKQKRY